MIQKLVAATAALSVAVHTVFGCCGHHGHTDSVCRSRAVAHSAQFGGHGGSACCHHEGSVEIGATCQCSAEWCSPLSGDQPHRQSCNENECAFARAETPPQIPSSDNVSLDFVGSPQIAGGLVSLDDRTQWLDRSFCGYPGASSARLQQLFCTWQI